MSARARLLLRLKRAAAFLLLSSMSACMMWHPANLAELAPEAVPERVRITSDDGTSFVLGYTTMSADSLRGVEEGGVSRSVAVTDVQTLEGWGFDPGFLFVPVIAAFLLLLAHFPLDDGPSGIIVN